MYFDEANKLSLREKASKAAEDIQKFAPSVFNAGDYQQSLLKLHKNETNFLLAESSLEQKDIEWLEDAIDQKSLIFAEPSRQSRELSQGPGRSKSQAKANMLFFRPESITSLKMRLAQNRWQKTEP